MLLFKKNILAVPPSMWDLSYPTRHQTPALEAWSLNHWATTEVFPVCKSHTINFMNNIGEGDGAPLQSSCLENPMDGGAW